MKRLITLFALTFLLMGCFGTETENKGSQVVVKFNKVKQVNGLAKMVAVDSVVVDSVQDTFVDTLSLDTIDDTIRLTYPVTTNVAYKVDVSGAIACNTEVGSNVTSNVTIDSLQVNTLLTTQGCVIEIDVKTDTLAYARRMALQHKWDIVRDMVGDTLTDSTLVATYLRGIWQNNGSATNMIYYYPTAIMYAEQYSVTPLLKRFTLNITKEISYDFLTDESLHMYTKYYVYHFIRLDWGTKYDMLKGLDISTDVFDPYPYGPLRS